MTPETGAGPLPGESDRGLHLLRELLRIRRFEERCVDRPLQTPEEL